jgi:hypothetical protein
MYLQRILIPVTVVVLACFAAALNAADARPDFSGTWSPEAWATKPWPSEPPFSSAGKAAQEAWEADNPSDPTHKCIFNLVRIVSAPFPHEIFQQEDRLTMIYEYQHQVRRVHMDGRTHDEDNFPTLMGHSIGSWDGDTLVIETRMAEAGYLRPQGFPHTVNMRLTERETVLDGGTRRKTELTIDDPEYYREPWTVTIYSEKVDEDLQDYDCIIREHISG